MVNTQEHSCGTTPWQANPRAPVQHCVPGVERLCMAECVIPCGSAVANWWWLSAWLLAVFTFLVCRIRTSTAVTKCARSIDARQGAPVGHLLLRAWCGRSGRSSGELIGAREGTGLVNFVDGLSIPTPKFPLILTCEIVFHPIFLPIVILLLISPPSKYIKEAILFPAS
jgi:hypothetical protein